MVYTGAGLLLEDGLYWCWAVTRGGFILVLGCYYRWVYTGAGLLLKVGLYWCWAVTKGWFKLVLGLLVVGLDWCWEGKIHM